MASYTPNLDLLKKNPLTEGSDTFNITTMLNDNWDKIDAKIGNPAELWVWEKRTVNQEAVPAHAVETEKNEYIFQKIGQQANKYYAMTIEYGSSITVSRDGTVSITSPSSVTDYPSNLRNYFLTGFVGKYIHITATSYTPSSNYFSTLNQNILYIPQAMTVDETTYDPHGTFREITGVADVPADITLEYFSSSNPSAYPDSQTVGNVTITKLGQIGEGMTKIETGSYVGTGTYGADNPNSLTFGFVPKIVIVGGSDNASGARYRIIMIYGSPYVTSQPGNGQGDIFLSWSGKTVSWYSRSGINYQMNMAYTYYYIAFG